MNSSFQEPSIVQLIRDDPVSTSVPFTMPRDNPLNNAFNTNNPNLTNQNSNTNSLNNININHNTHSNNNIQQPPHNPLIGMDILANKSKTFGKETGNMENMEKEVESNFEAMDNENKDNNEFVFDQNERSHFDVNDGNSEVSDLLEENMIFDETNEDVIAEKRKLLFKIYCMERKGVTLTKKFTMMNSFEDLKNEYDRVAHEHNVTSSIRFSRKMLMMSVTAMEYLNTKFDPFDISLDGWSETVHENVVDYDDVFSELYEKYHTKAQIAPEVKLMLMLGGSGFMFHLTNSMFKQNQLPSAFMNQLGRQSQKNTMNNSMNHSMNQPIGVDDILSELKQNKDLDSMSDDSQSIISTISDDNKFVKIKRNKRRRYKGSSVRLDI